MANPNYTAPYKRIYKKSPRERARVRAWTSFSRIIRLIGAIKTTGTMEHVICCTCGKMIKAFGAKNMGETCADAGHWPKLDGRTDNVLFVLKGVHAQCVACNQYGHGMPDEYDIFMEDNYTPEEVEEIRAWNYKTSTTCKDVDFSEDDFQEIHLFCRAMEKVIRKTFNGQECELDKPIPNIFKKQGLDKTVINLLTVRK